MARRNLMASTAVRARDIASFDAVTNAVIYRTIEFENGSVLRWRLAAGELAPIRSLFGIDHETRRESW